MTNHSPGWSLVAGIAVCILPLIARSADGNGLRLVAESSGVKYDQFSVAEGRIMVRRDRATEGVPADAVWRLDGDLRAASEFFWFAPEYDVVTSVASESLETDPVLRHALVRLRGQTAWNYATLRGGIVVVVWLVDGRAVEVVPVAARAHDNEAVGLVAAVAVPLSPATTRGVPAVMLWKGNRFVAPRRWFRDAAADTALAEIFLGSSEQVAASLSAVRNVDVRPELPEDEQPRREAIVPGELGAVFARRDAESEVTSLVDDALFSLADLALEAGRIDALQTLLERGAQMNGSAPRPSAALRSAAQNGRFDVIAFLRDRSVASLDTEGLRADLRRRAMSTGHADVAALLVESGGGTDADKIATLALLQGDVAALTQLIARGATAAVLAQPPALVALNIRLGRTNVIRALLDAGLSPRGVIDGTPWLVAAAAAAQPDVVRVLLENGAAVGEPASGGITPLIDAATCGSVECVDLLIAAGADVNAVDAHDRTALHFALAANRPSVVERLLEQGRAEQRRDDQGLSSLDLALAMQSPELVGLLARHGATIDVARPGVDEAIQHALAIDAVDLLQRAAADGWNPQTRFHEIWSSAAIAQLQGANHCAAWIESVAPGSAGSGPSLERGDIAAAFAAGDKPAEVRTADSWRPAASVKVAGVAAADGAFLFPRIAECADARLANSVLSAARTWRFHPATMAGRAVASRVALMIPFAGAERRIFPAGDVTIAPTCAGGTSTAPESATVPVTAQLFQPGRGGGAPTSATVEFGALSPTASSDFWAAASFVVEPDGHPDEIQILGVEGMVPRDGWAHVLSGWKFTPGQVDGRPVRTRVTLLVQSVN